MRCRSEPVRVSGDEFLSVCGVCVVCVCLLIGRTKHSGKSVWYAKAVSTEIVSEKYVWSSIGLKRESKRKLDVRED